MLTTFVVRDGRVTPGPVDADALTRLRDDHGARVWVDLEDPTAEEFDLLSAVFDFHPLAIEDCRIQNELPKLDDYGSDLFLVLHCPDDHAAPASLTTTEHHFFVAERYLVTVHDRPSLVITEARQQALRDAVLLTRGTDFLLHGLIDRIADRYVRLLDEFDALTDELERRVVARPEPALLEDVFALKRNLLHLVRLSHLQRDVVHRLSRDSFAPIGDTARLYFRDVYDHLFQVSIMAEFYRETVAGVRDTYLAVVSNRLNEAMKVLTLFATLLLPLTVVTGIYGMNFEQMPELHWRYGYPAVLVGMGAIVFGLFTYYKRRGWW